MQQFLQFIILTFIRSSTRFVRLHARHRGLNDCSSSLWFYLRIVVIAVLPFVFEHKQQHGYHHDTKVKPEAATAVEPPMTGVRTHETCRAANRCQDNKLEKLLHLVGDLFELYDDAQSYDP